MCDVAEVTDAMIAKTVCVSEIRAGVAVTPASVAVIFLVDVEGDDITYHHQERATGSFMRSVAFHSEVDAEKVGAVLKDGLLKITLPKAAAAKARKISVQTE